MPKQKKMQPRGPRVDYGDAEKRLNRVSGQVDGIKRMLEDGRRLDDILIQCKAVHSALRSVEYKLLEAYLDQALLDLSDMDRRKVREEKIEELIELYRPL